MDVDTLHFISYDKRDQCKETKKNVNKYPTGIQDQTDYVRPKGFRLSRGKVSVLTGSDPPFNLPS